MSKVVVLGGCGAVGSVAVQTLARQPAFSQIVIGDMNAARAEELIREVGADRVSFVPVDASDPVSVRAAIAGTDIVLNCVGPFYKTVTNILGTVIEAGINYVDICDDVDVTLDIFKLDEAAKRAGITALIGMGASPGATNLLAKYIVESQLEETDSIDIFHCHGGEPTEGPGVIGHRFHCMSIDIPMFLDGELKYVRYFEEDGIALRQTFDFPVLGPTPIFPYPHPEQVTLPRYLKVRQVTNKGSVVPMEYYNLTGEMCRLGLSSKEPLAVQGQTVVPYDFAVAFLIRERERILKETNFGIQRGCMSVVVKGRKRGEAREVRVHMASGNSGLGEGTGIPAAIGVMLMQAGKITTKGVLPPEGCVDPMGFIAVATEVMFSAASKSGEKKAPLLMFETIAADGSVTRMEM
jgi:saccharopine dehydrogenase (NAD+, L-lysine-forming)